MLNFQILTISLPEPRWAGNNTDLTSDINISKTVVVNIAFLKEYSISFLMVCRLVDFALVVLELLMFKVCGIIGISKIEFFNFSGSTFISVLNKHAPRKLKYLRANNAKFISSKNTK